MKTALLAGALALVAVGCDGEPAIDAAPDAGGVDISNAVFGASSAAAR